jgi:hypothetical protein
MSMKAVSPALLERLRDLSLVELDTLLGSLPEDAAKEMLLAFVADLEEALLEARAVLRRGHAQVGAGADPLGYVDLGPERRSEGGDERVAAASEVLGDRAAARRELARLEEMVRGVLPRLLEADRRFVALGG